MPLIAEVLLAVSVGCVEITNTTANQEGDEMDSYQVDSTALSNLFHHVLTCHNRLSGVFVRKEIWSACGDSG